MIGDIIIVRFEGFFVLGGGRAPHDADVNLADSVTAFRNGLNLVLNQTDGYPYHPADGVVHGFDRPSSSGRVHNSLARRSRNGNGCGGVGGTTRDRATVEDPLFSGRLDNFTVENSFYVSVRNGFLLVSRGLEAFESRLNHIFGKTVVSEFLETFLERVLSRVLAKNQRGLEANTSRGHDLVRRRVFQDTILVDASLMGESISPNDGFVRLHGHASHRSDHAACPGDLRGVDQRLHREHLWAGVEGHHDFLQGCISGAFTDAVNRNFNLASTTHDTLKGVSHSQTQIVVAVGRPHDAVTTGRVFLEISDKLTILSWCNEPDSVGNINRGYPCLDNLAEELSHECRVTSSSILSRKFHIFAHGTRKRDRLHGLCDTLFAGDAQFVL
mmetsp:Transcript_29852/g.58326  ORF Transcript_29852/g.58326 Transcript_29852/m.58326 type:complete len:385 (+) Transcript_29852:667-1821(+)